MSAKNRTIPKALADLVDTGRGWFGAVRVRAITYVLGIALATAAVILWTPIGWVPAVGVAVCAAVVTISRVADRLTASPVCYQCGVSLEGATDGEHGIVCPSCGSLHQGRRMALGREIDPRAHDQIAANDDQPNT